MNLLLLLPAGAALHISEEFLVPGGFMAWYRNYRPELAESITPRFLFTINAVLLAFCFLPLALGYTPYGVALWLSIVAVLFINALFHIHATIKTKNYSPGTITSLLIYIPLAGYGFWTFISSGQASVGTAMSSFIIGASYHWFSLWNHRRRVKKTRT